MRVRVLVQPTGLINGQPWPEPGGELDLEDVHAQPMIEAGWLARASDKPKTEKRPSQVKAEQRTG